MPTQLVYLIVLFLFILIAFLTTKLSIYQVMGLGFVLMLAMTGTWAYVFTFLDATFSTSLLYTIFAFLVLSLILDRTGVINDCINILLALIGRLPGASGYVSVLSSAFMGAISGSGPGNVAATGVITIPAMKRSGFPAHLAANIEAAASTLGNMIPPSGVIIAAYGCYTAAVGEEMISIGQFWIILWGIALWFVIQRLLTVYFLCKAYHVKPMEAHEIPNLKTCLREGWRSLLIPVIILFPFVFDYLGKSTFIAARIGTAGASSFSSSLLLFIPGMTALYAILISKNKEMRSFTYLLGIFEKSVKSIVPTLITLIFAYAIGEVLDHIGTGPALAEYLGSFNFSKVAIAFLLPLLTALLGMIFPGSAQIAIMGPSMVTLMVSCGMDVLMAAAVLPCICGAMSGIIPPVAVCTLTAMSIAESDTGKTMANSLVWVALHYIMSVLLMLGVLPIIGL